MHPAIFTLAVLFTLIEKDNAENPQDVSLTTQCMPGAECDVALNFVQKGQRSEKASIHEQQDMEAKTECSADFGEDKACCGQPGDWWAAENNYPNGLRNCPQNEPICDGYQEYLKMGICKAKTECSANFGETQACCGQALSNRRLRNCPQNEPICHDYKDNVKMGICRAEVKIRCSADFGEEKACCGQLGDWWAAERKKIFPNGLRNCPQNQPICVDYKEYVKMGICMAKVNVPVFKTTTITFNDGGAFKNRMYTEIFPKAASYMVEFYRREVNGKCEEYMKFENQAQFEQYKRNNWFWASQSIIDDFAKSASDTGYSDMNEDQFLDKKKGAEKVIAACKEPFPFPKPDNNKICYRDLDWASYARLGYWGKDNCVCGDGICEKEAGAALAATKEPYRSAWQSSCTVTQCPL